MILKGMKREEGYRGKMENVFGRKWEKGNHELVIVKIGHRKK